MKFDKVWLYCAVYFIEEGRIRLAIGVGKVVGVEERRKIIRVFKIKVKGSGITT